MAISKQEVTSDKSGLTYIAAYEMEKGNTSGRCSVYVKQNSEETLYLSYRDTAQQIKTTLAPVPIKDDPSAKPAKLVNFFDRDRIVDSLLVATKSMINKSKVGNLDYDVVTFYLVNNEFKLQVIQATATAQEAENLGFKPLELGEPDMSTEEILATRDREASAARGESSPTSSRTSGSDNDRSSASAGSSSSIDSDDEASSSSIDSDDEASSSSIDSDDEASSSSIDSDEAPDTAGGTERSGDTGTSSDTGGGGGSGTQALKKKESTPGGPGKPAPKAAPKEAPPVSKIRKAKSNTDHLEKAEYIAAGIPLGSAGAEGTEPKDFTMVQTIPDPMGDRNGSKYNDPRYVFKKDVAKTGDSGDYVGSDYEYNVWIDSSKIKTKADLIDANMPFVYFEIAKDVFNEVPYGVDRNRDFTGLKIYHDGSITGNKAGLNNDSFFNILYTYLELWNSYKEISNLPAAPAPTPEAPAPAPGPGQGDSGPVADPDLDIIVTPPAQGGVEKKTGPCCHTGVKLDLACYKRIWQEYPNGVTPKDCDKIYREKAGNVPNFLRGIEKDGDEWVHYIKDRQTGNFVAVTTTGNTLLNYAQSASIKKIKIFKGGLGGFRDSAKTNDPEFNNVFRTLRTTIKDVRVFLPYDPSMGPDSCGLTDDEVFARTDWTIQLREDKQMRIIRRQIRNLLLSQRS